MSWKANLTGATEDQTVDPAVERALSDFRQSVHAWSEALYVRPRIEARVSVHRSWRMTVVWALGCVLAAGSLSGGIVERHHRHVVAKLAAEARAAREQQMAAERARKADTDLLVAVDSDISREVPAALEPLAQLMDENSDQ